MTNPPEPPAAVEAEKADSDLESARQAYGPEWPAWLSMTSIEPEPEAFL